MGYLCFKNSALLFERNKKGFYICTRLRDTNVSLRRAGPLNVDWRNGSPDSYREVECDKTHSETYWRNGRAVECGSLENC